MELEGWLGRGEGNKVWMGKLTSDGSVLWGERHPSQNGEINQAVFKVQLIPGRSDGWDMAKKKVDCFPEATKLRGEILLKFICKRQSFTGGRSDQVQ